VASGAWSRYTDGVRTASPQCSDGGREGSVAWIVFDLPGIALVCRSWPLVLPSLVGYALFKRLIRREDGYLEERFGMTYRSYRAEVPEVFPRFWGRG
jgi:hypothetical protein